MTLISVPDVCSFSITVHSGCSFSATVWFIYFAVKITQDFVHHVVSLNVTHAHAIGGSRRLSFHRHR